VPSPARPLGVDDTFRRFLFEAELAAGGGGADQEILRQIEERFSTLIARADTQE